MVREMNYASDYIRDYKIRSLLKCRAFYKNLIDVWYKKNCDDEIFLAIFHSTQYTSLTSIRRVTSVIDFAA
jgi:hypothetical protein